ncbi:MAG: hypothetical protein KJ811_00955, partial [Candidatus Margulisbacteria bacterium]|nr:hypothetical protein [Candidatus Margulisiibacteriota bacterium]
YYPRVNNYKFILYGAEGSGASNKPANGTDVTHRLPETVYDNEGNSAATITGTTANASTGYGWCAEFTNDSINSIFLTPEVVPSGTYTSEVTGRATYTFKNVKGCDVVAVGATSGIVFPVFKVVTNEAGAVTAVQYKWKIRESGVVRDATAAEVKAFVSVAAPNGTSFVQTSPGIELIGSDGTYRSPLAFLRDGSSVDATSLNITWAVLNQITAYYSLNNNIQIRFRFYK